MHRNHVMGTVPRVPHIVHLGHPLTPSLSHASIYTLVLDGLEHTLGVLGTQPLPPLMRAEVTRTVIRPTLLYRLECCLPPQPALGKLTQRLVDYVLQVNGLPPFVSTKTLFSHQSCGLGIPFLPVLQPTRVLGAAQKAQAYCDRTWAPTEPPYRPSALFFQARSGLYGPTSQPPLPFTTIPDSLTPCPATFSLEIYRSRYRNRQLGDGHSDGSFHRRLISAPPPRCAQMGTPTWRAPRGAKVSAKPR